MFSIQYSCVALVCFSLVYVNGCNREPIIVSAEQRLTEDNSVASISQGDLEGTFIPEHVDSNHFHAWYFVHNTRSVPFSAGKVMVRSDRPPVIATPIIQPPTLLMPDEWHHGIVEIPKELDSESCLALEYGTPNGGEQNLLRMTREGSELIKNLTISDNLTSMYLSWQSSDAMDEKSIQTVLVNGVAPERVQVLSLPSLDSTFTQFVELSLKQPLKRGQGAVVVVKLKSGTSYFGARKAFDLFFIGPTQYECPLRIASVKQENGHFLLGAYNESNSSKPDLLIDDIFVNGVRVTDECELPPTPLPADRQRFTQDVKTLVLPKLSAARVHTVQIDYHLLAPKYATGDAEARSSRSLCIEIASDLPLPIGKSSGCDLSGCICVVHEGLVPLPSPSELRKVIHSVAGNRQNAPVYARIRYGQSHEAIPRLFNGCDFLVAEPPRRYDSAEQKDPLRDFIEYQQALNNHSLPWVASIVADTSTDLSAPCLRLLTLISLGQGSKGVESMASAHGELQSGRRFSLCRLHDTSSAEKSQIKCLYSTAHPARLSTSCSQNGVFISSLIRDSKSIILTVVNLWNTRTIKQPDTSHFYSVPRKNLEIAIQLGNDWKLLSATDCGTGQQLEFDQESTRGEATISMPSLKLGRILLLSRCPQTASDSSIAPTGFLADLPIEDGNIYPLTNPFIKLGDILADSQNRIMIPISNDGVSAVPVNATLVPELSSNPMRVKVETKLLEPHECSEVILELSASPFLGNSLTTVRISPINETVGGFYAFIEATTCELVRSIPTVVDFGQFRNCNKLLPKEVLLQSSFGRCQIQSVIMNPDIPIDFVVSEDEQRIHFRPIPENFGKFKSVVTVKGIIPTNGSVFSHAIHFDGEFLPQIKCKPNLVAFRPRRDHAVKRVVTLTAHGATPFVVHRVSSEGFVGITSASSSQLMDSQTVSLEFAPSLSSRRLVTSIGFTCRHADGEVSDVVVPLWILGTHEDERDLSEKNDNASQIKATLLARTKERAKSTVSNYQKRSLPINAGAWVRAHAILMYGSNGYQRSDIEHDIKPLFSSLLNSPALDHPPFVIRNNRPYPQHRGSLFIREHHPDQFLAYLAMAGVPLHAPLMVSGKKFTVSDLLKQSQYDTVVKTGEKSWTVLAYSKYLAANAKWNNKYGETVSFNDLGSVVLAEDNLACGGGHKLQAIAALLNRWRSVGNPELVKALDDYLRQSVQDLKKYQRRDGGFRLPRHLEESFKGQKLFSPHMPDIQYMGHTLEWITMACEPEQLEDQWILQAIEHLCNILDIEYGTGKVAAFESDVDSYCAGFTGHAVSGLQRWLDKVVR